MVILLVNTCGGPTPRTYSEHGSISRTLSAEFVIDVKICSAINSIKNYNHNGVGLEEIDEAFNWLVLILGTLAATLVGSMHLFPLPSPPLTPKIEIQFLRLLFVPFIVLIISWLSSHLIQNKEVRIVLKSFSWIYALLLLVIDLLFFLSVILGKDIRASPLVVGSFWIPSLVYLIVIRKRYKLIFPDSKFLKSNRKQVLFCVIITTITVLQAAASAPLV